MTSRKDETDVVVIGSGAGGAPLAMSLAESGARVVVLEKGEYHTISDFSNDEVAICRRDFWVPWETEDPHTIRQGRDGASEITREGWTSQCVGGATVHMSGFTYRFKDSDMRLKTRTGGIQGANLADWPIGIDDLLPWYDLYEARAGVSGQWKINPFETRRRPFPLPAMRPHPAAALLDEAGRSLGYHPFPTPMAILSRAWGNRTHCTYCGFCGDYGCSTNARSTALSTFIPQAEATGRCQVRARCMAKQIRADEQDKVRSVVYVDPDGREQEILARAVVVACSAIESARLLLLSRSGRFPHGLGNNSGLIGKNLMFSGFGKGTAVFDLGKLTDKLGRDGMDLPFLMRSFQDDYWNEKWELPLPKGGTHNFLFHHPNPINAAVRLAMDSKFSIWGKSLKERMRKYFHEELWIEFEVFSEFLPTDECFMDLDPKVKDRWGLPVARITEHHHPLADNVNRLMTRHGLDILEAIRPAAEKVSPWAWAQSTYHLPAGTCRFGNDPSTSVLDKHCQSHEVKNLYVTDGAFMPSAGSAPTTPTLQANSLRVADYIRQRFARREV